MSEKKLELIIQPKIIDHLGIKMYQKPVAVVSELIANSWDADAEEVDIIINQENFKISINDNGNGMSFNECQDYYLQVGRDRRQDMGTDLSKNKKRPVLGRKGIGKFAGFGIANKISIETISEENGEETKFLMDLDKILKSDEENKGKKEIKLIKSYDPDENKRKKHFTIIELTELKVNINIEIETFITELSSRFLLPQMCDDFIIRINGAELPKNFSDEMEFSFPNDLSTGEYTKIQLTEINENGWGKEIIEGYEILWRIGFYEDTIKSEYLRGISIFSRGKIAQKPFFFDLSGGISGQNALEYMTGQVIMDFIDEGEFNLISTERQRINLQTEIGKKIQAWGIKRIKYLAQLWKDRRSQKRLQELENRISGFKERLDILPLHERKTVKSVLTKIASFSRLGKDRFHDWCNAVLTSWETGRLKELIYEISETESFDEAKLIEILSEADVLTALNIAESVKTKIVTIGELKLRVEKKQLENKVRDYIYKHPWIIHPKWEHFKKERSVKKIIDYAGTKNLKYEPFNGRVDLTLSSGSNLLLIEFMRPGLELNRDHLDRINYYTIDIRNAIERETANPIDRLEASYIIADNYKDFEAIKVRIAQLEKDQIFIMTWNTLIMQALKQWEDYLNLLKLRNPRDPRLQSL